MYTVKITRLFSVFHSARQTHAHETLQDQRPGRGEHILYGFQSVSDARDASVQTRHERNGKQVMICVARMDTCVYGTHYTTYTLFITTGSCYTTVILLIPTFTRCSRSSRRRRDDDNTHVGTTRRIIAAVSRFSVTCWNFKHVAQKWPTQCDHNLAFDTHSYCLLFRVVNMRRNVVVLFFFFFQFVLHRVVHHANRHAHLLRNRNDIVHHVLKHKFIRKTIIRKISSRTFISLIYSFFFLFFFYVFVRKTTLRFRRNNLLLKPLQFYITVQ